MQTAPGLSLLLPGLDLARLHAGVGEQERLGEVVPRGVATEVGHLHGVPGRRAIVAGERRAGVGALLDDVAVSGLDGEPFGIDVEHRDPVRGGERRVDEVLAACVHVEGLVRKHVRPAFHAPEGAAERQVRRERAHARPAVQTAVRIKHEGH